MVRVWQTLLTDSRRALPPEWELWQAMKAQAQPVWSPWHLPKPVYERNLPQPFWAARPMATMVEPLVRPSSPWCGGSPLKVAGQLPSAGRSP